MITTNPKPLYTPKVRQQVISNKLLNSALRDLYDVVKVQLSVDTLRKILQKDGTIVYLAQIYIVTYLDVLPCYLFSGQVHEVTLSLRKPKYDTSGKVLSYCLVYL